MLAQGAYQGNSDSERIELGRARGSGKQVGRPPTLTPEQIEQCQRMAHEGADLRQIARVMTCSRATVKGPWQDPDYGYVIRHHHGRIYSYSAVVSRASQCEGRAGSYRLDYLMISMGMMVGLIMELFSFWPSYGYSRLSRILGLISRF